MVQTWVEKNANFTWLDFFFTSSNIDRFLMVSAGHTFFCHELLSALLSMTGLKRGPLPTVEGKNRRACLVVAPSNESSSTRGGPLPPPLVSGRGKPNHPLVPSTNSNDEFMAQAKANLELVIVANAALSPNVPPKVTQQTGDYSNLDEGDNIVTLDQIPQCPFNRAE